MSEQSKVEQPILGMVMHPTLYFVVRQYRRNRRVLCVSESESEARVIYVEARAKLRDGDVFLWKCEQPIKMEATCGGYNRTRW